MADSIKTYHLEMTSEAQHQARPLTSGLELREACVDQYRLNKFLYQEIGHDWNWTWKLGWTDTEWRRYVEDPGLRTWILYHRGSIAGYFELQHQTPETVEIMYFGLSPIALGKGFGAGFLSSAIDCAWQWRLEAGKIRRVWLHTCSLDHPHALQNYKNRGFSVFKVESDAETGGEHDIAIDAAKSVLHEHIEALNSQDEKAIARTLHFPHYRITPGGTRIWPTSESYFSDFKLRAGSEWNKSAFKDVTVVRASSDKVHIDTLVERYRGDGSLLESFYSLWVITYENDRWAASLRSSFALS